MTEIDDFELFKLKILKRRKVVILVILDAQIEAMVDYDEFMNLDFEKVNIYFYRMRNKELFIREDWLF